MAGKPETASGNAADIDYFPSEILGVKIAGIGRAWESAKALFDYKKADDALRRMMEFGDVGLAVTLLIAGGLLAFIFIMLANIEYFYVARLEVSIYEELTAEELPVPDISLMVPVGLVNFLVYVPFAVLMNLLFERITFSVARATGGKGRFGQHLTLISVVWLAVAVTTAANLLGPFGGCLTLVPIAVIVLVGIMYLMIYTSARAYAIVHGIAMAHALTISVISITARIALAVLALQSAASLLGYPLEGV